MAYTRTAESHQHGTHGRLVCIPHSRSCALTRYRSSFTIPQTTATWSQHACPSTSKKSLTGCDSTMRDSLLRGICARDDDCHAYFDKHHNALGHGRLCTRTLQRCTQLVARSHRGWCCLGWASVPCQLGGHEHLVGGVQALLCQAASTVGTTLPNASCWTCNILLCSLCACSAVWSVELLARFT
jgi:hypothetical protein